MTTKKTKIDNSLTDDSKSSDLDLSQLPDPVLITGAAGFIGRYLTNRLLEADRRVVAFDVIACPESLAEDASVTWIQGDITNTDQVNEAMQGCATVFHLAAVVGDWGGDALHRSVTVEGTHHIFDAALKLDRRPRIVLASSIVVYGDQINEQVCHEGLPLGKTFGPYSESKQAQERMAQQYLQRGLDIRIVRPANVYGAGSKPWVEELCIELKRGVPVLIGGGDFDAGLVHVDNVVEVLLRAAINGQARGQIYNAADEEGVTWKQYMTDLARICGAPKPRSIPRIVALYLAKAGEKSFRLLRRENRPPLTLEALNLVGSEHHIDMMKTRRELGYAPVTRYEAGMAAVEEYLQG